MGSKDSKQTDLPCNSKGTSCGSKGRWKGAMKEKGMKKNGCKGKKHIKYPATRNISLKNSTEVSLIHFFQLQRSFFPKVKNDLYDYDWIFLYTEWRIPTKILAFFPCPSVACIFISCLWPKLLKRNPRVFHLTAFSRCWPPRLQRHNDRWIGAFINS